MLVAGIDVGAEVHHVAVVDEAEAAVIKPTAFAEHLGGYQKYWGCYSEPGHGVAKTCPWCQRARPPHILVVMEASGHYWQNLFAALVAQGYTVALVNRLRTHRFAGEELARTKTDRINCLQIARFGAQKRPAATDVPGTLVEELRELMRCAGAWCKKQLSESASSTAWWTWAFPNSPAISASLILSWPPPSCGSIRQRRLSAGSSAIAWRTFVTTAAIVDTASPSGQLALGLAALAEFQRELKAERTKAGMATARARNGGRPYIS